MKKISLLIPLFILLSSHELFLKTDSYYLNANESSELYLFNGTFDESENVITRDRIINAKVLGPDYKFLPAEGDYYDKGEVTYLKFNSGSAGTYVAGVSTLPKVIELSATDFKEYLEHEGLEDVISERQKKGIDSKPAREKYSKHVKAILQVSEKRTNHFAAKLDYPIEFIPVNNPYVLNPGDEISFRLLSKGEPLPNQVVHYSSRTSGGGPASESSTRTDKNGVLTFKLTSPGKWYVATINIVESQERDIDYESNWATLTFEIK